MKFSIQELRLIESALLFLFVPMDSDFEQYKKIKELKNKIHEEIKRIEK